MSEACTVHLPQVSSAPSRRRRRRVPRWATARRLAGASFLALLVLGAGGGTLRPDAPEPEAPRRALPAAPIGPLRGAASGTQLLDVVPFVDPLAALESAAAARRIETTTVIGAALVLGTSAILGPVFCGWLCPLGLACDLNQALRGLVRRRVLRRRRAEEPPRRVLPRASRGAVLAGVLAFALVAGMPLFSAWSPIGLVVHALLFAALPAAAIVGAILVLEWLRPRIWCRELCPLGALHALAGRRGLLRVRIDRDRAGRTPCRQCSRACPMGIPVMEAHALAGRDAVDDPRCIRCGACIDPCPSGVLSMGMRAGE